MEITPLILWAEAYLALVNLAAFTVFAWDKYCARNGMWRVAESTLLTLAAVGGSPAMIAGQYALRHKTWKEPFRTYLRIIAGLQAIALVTLSFPEVRDALWSMVGGSAR
jgi:uncharacterized membrane protein YsdA (DUF1294 family)